MPKITYVITGDEAINRKLAKLTSKQAKSVFRKSARPALKPVLAEARSQAPTKTGTLRRSIKIKALKRSRSAIGLRITTGTDTSDFQGRAFYGGFQEYGWKVGSRNLGDNRTQVKGLHFMRNAARKKQAEAIRIYKSELVKNIMALTR